jgi:hypothetical protein
VLFVWQVTIRKDMKKKIVEFNKYKPNLQNMLIKENSKDNIKYYIIFVCIKDYLKIDYGIDNAVFFEELNNDDFPDFSNFTEIIKLKNIENKII